MCCPEASRRVACLSCTNVKDGRYSRVKFSLSYGLPSGQGCFSLLSLSFFLLYLIFFLLPFVGRGCLTWHSDLLSAVISAINGHNKAALKLSRAEAAPGCSGKKNLRGCFCSSLQISVPFLHDKNLKTSKPITLSFSPSPFLVAALSCRALTLEGEDDKHRSRG